MNKRFFTLVYETWKPGGRGLICCGNSGKSAVEFLGLVFEKESPPLYFVRTFSDPTFILVFHNF